MGGNNNRLSNEVDELIETVELGIEHADSSIDSLRRGLREKLAVVILIGILYSLFLVQLGREAHERMDNEHEMFVRQLGLRSQLSNLRLLKDDNEFRKELGEIHQQGMADLAALHSESVVMFEEYEAQNDQFQADIEALSQDVERLGERFYNEIDSIREDLNRQMDEGFENIKEALRRKREGESGGDTYEPEVQPSRAPAAMGA
jgi:hypothetical protein